MGKWSNSLSGNLRYSVNRQNNSGIYIGPTRGLSSPKNSRQACLCVHSDTYDVKCCKGALISQGIGQTQGSLVPPLDLGAFSFGFSDGFEIN
jgi:hypothetical protein